MSCKTGYVAVTASLIMLMLNAGPSSAAGSGLLFEGPASTSLEAFTISGNEPSVDAETTRSGGYAIKSTLDYNSSKTRYRTELRPKIADVNARQDYWYGFSIYLPESHVTDSVAWEIVAQWHRTPDAGEEYQNPPLTLNTTGGRWGIRNNWDASPLTENKQYDGSKGYDLGLYERGKWTDWVFHIKWSYEGDGVLQIWKDGTLVVSQNGPNCYNDQRMPYFKMGIYKAWKDGQKPDPLVTKRVVYHSDLRIAGPEGSYDAVAPGKADSLKPMAPALLTSH